MHRQRVRLSERVPGRARRLAQAVERSAIVATYEIHDRLLSNRRSRALYSEDPPRLDALQREVVDKLDAEGYATVPLADLVDQSHSAALARQGAAFVGSTEEGLAHENSASSSSELRRRPGKEFLIRAHSFDGARLSLDHPWFRLCLSPHLLGVANAYLRMWSKLSYVDLWYTVPQPESAERVASQLWHYDFDDKHLLKAFLYLADVDAATGPFEYVAGSQPGGQYHTVSPWQPMGYGRVPEADVQQSVPAAAIRSFIAPKGTLIFCNTSGLHRGGFATGSARVLATATYCSPASLAALSLRNYEAADTELGSLSASARYAIA